MIFCTFRKFQRFEIHEDLWLPWQLKENTLVALYQNTSNCGGGVKTGHMLLALGFHKEIKEEIFFS